MRAVRWNAACSHSQERLPQGVWERDEIRKDDSFEAFEEILHLAEEQDVDLILLGGDLFHDNNPSRGTVVRLCRCRAGCSSVCRICVHRCSLTAALRLALQQQLMTKPTLSNDCSARC